MENKNLQHTKKKLAFIFASLVFFIAFFLELTYFSIKYTNTNYVEKRDFHQVTTLFENQFKDSNKIFDLFRETIFKIKERSFMWDRREKWWWDFMDWPLRFLNFVILDWSWNVVFESINQDIDYVFDYDDLHNDEIVDKNWLLIKKVYLWWDNYENVIFFKKSIYSMWDYLKDLLYFTSISIIFSIMFYFIWLLFVEKNLKPVEENLKDMDDFVHNASHEMKTPLSVISSNLQLVKRLKSYDENLVDNSVQEIKRIDSLIEWLTSLSSISSVKKIDVFLVWKEVWEIMKEFENILKEKNIKVTISINKDFYIKASRDYFYILFSNLLRNAIKYNGEKNPEININISKNHLSIENSWTWIWESDLDKIFERFYKCDTSRNTEWFWIWLSLVKKICDIYDWDISVSSELNKKTKFEIRF